MSSQSVNNSNYILSNHIDFEDLKIHFDEKVSDLATDIMERMYQVAARAIGSQARNGYEFPMNPEVLDYSLKWAKGKSVLEIGGASGKVSILHALAGANQVYMNELDENENKTFEESVKKLPLEIQKKIHAVPGDCLESLAKMETQVDLVLCSNVIHFFNDEKQDRFFQLLKKILKTGGQTICLNNSMNHKTPEIFEANPELTSITVSSLTLHDYSHGTAPVKIFFQERTPSSGDQVSMQFKAINLYKKEKGNTSWTPNREEFSGVNKKIKKMVVEVLNGAKNDDLFKAIEFGVLRLTCVTTRSYNEKTLTQLFDKQGYKALNTFYLGFHGHIIADSETNKRLVGGIFQKD
jgi:SAM-dependent methyltransferase